MKRGSLKGGRGLFLALLFLCLWAISGASTAKVLMIIAPEGFRDEELKVPKELFESKGLVVEVASSKKEEARGMLGLRVKPDLSLREVDVARYEAVIFVGGIGAQVYFSHPEALRIAKEAYTQGKVVGAICIAPVILAKAGVLEGKRATVWPSEGRTLTALGASYTAKAVEVDGRVVTANGPQAARAFAERILELLAK